MKFTGPQTLTEKGPVPFSDDDPHRQEEIARLLAAKAALKMIDQGAAPAAQPTIESAPVDLSHLPPPHPSTAEYPQSPAPQPSDKQLV